MNEHGKHVVRRLICPFANRRRPHPPTPAAAPFDAAILVPVPVSVAVPRPRPCGRIRNGAQFFLPRDSAAAALTTSCLFNVGKLPHHGPVSRDSWLDSEMTTREHWPPTAISCIGARSCIALHCTLRIARSTEHSAVMYGTLGKPDFMRARATDPAVRVKTTMERPTSHEPRDILPGSDPLVATWHALPPALEGIPMASAMPPPPPSLNCSVHRPH